ncbi:nitrate- and nitrite sensing domain-containing protein [Actinoplanes sp. NPDC051343]|uniref:sensor histidine kinase n=1 Tax=Actinoplanes sp. NPDC051343 TaxID=3363906 RepID=UPI00378E015F
MSRLRRPADRLRDLPIWSKLGLIMLVPTLATIIVGVSGLVDHINTASNAERARSLSALSQAAGGLVDHLQNERAYAVMIKTNKDTNQTVYTAAKKAYNNETGLVDQAKLAYSQQRLTVGDVPYKVNNLLTRLDNNLSDLPATRSQAADAKLELDSIKSTYNTLINDLLSVRDDSSELSDNTDLGDHMRTVAAVAQAKEYVAEQRDVGHEILQRGRLTSDLRREFTATETGFDLAVSTLNSVGSDPEIAQFKAIGSQADARAATNLTVPIDFMSNTTTDIPFDSQKWESAMTGYDKLFRGLEEKLDASVVSQATDIRNGVNRRVFIETSVLLGMLLLAILFAWLVARSMARSLRELRQGALSVAQFGLPHAVERLRDPALSGSLTPAQVADQIAEPLPVRSRDEFGQVTEAFNAVHLEAVRTAAEQAALRGSVATMFVNLARRSQILVDRLIGHLDRLERGEEDPDRLAELFQLDHLATRMRRNDENLLVLAGADSTRVQREAAALIDVLRAAQSEVEHYTRIEFGIIDRDIEVSAHAVNDMVHLVAELFDNATAFSPPNSTVIVEARRLGDGALLSVEDRGIGISRDQLNDLNERLANPPMVDVAVSRMMGLVVVARLANRHAVKVELRPADTERGTIAEVGLPSSVLMGGSGVPAVAGGRGQLGPGFDGGPQGGPQRGGFPEPLALESGRGGYPGSRPFDPNPPMPNGGMLGTGGRSVPAWSDLTGAPSNGFANGSSNGFANGSTNGGGMNGFYGPRSNEVIPPLPSGPSGQPQGFAGPDGLPQRRNGGEPVRTDGDSGGYGATIPRQLPSNPETQGRGPALPPISSPPVPPISAPPVPSGPPFGGRPVSSPPEQQPPFQQQAPYQPPSQQAPYQQAPYQQAPSQQAPYQQPPVQPQQAASAPPAWPPVAPERGPDAPPHVPESLAAALDMTTELPRYRPDQSTRQPQAAPIPSSAPPVSATPVSATPTSGGPQTEAQRAAAAARAAHEAAAVQAAEAQATAAAQIAAAQAAARQRENGGTQYADETMELPIFRELESAWFMTSAPPANAPAKPAAPAPDNNGLGDDTISSQRFSTAEPARSVGVPHQAGPPESRELDPATVGAAVSNGNAAPAAAASTSPWQTAADEGWQAARAAAEMPVDTTTTAGLPKRTPMAQLVPGGVDRGGNSVQRRTPEGVRGLLSAYHRGVQRGRTQEPSTNPEGTPGGQQSSQAGKEHEA